ncbi:MAG: hypothetical protein KR126chlam3_01035 [Chlamydiae bacterium]|nr:hypothetical protein [Chlamydiota bacterium]
MNSLLFNATNFFNSEGASLSPEKRLAGIVVSIAFLTAGLFLRRSAQSSRPTPAGRRFDCLKR